MRVGAWTIHLPLETTGRFPEIDQHVPQAADAASHCRLTDSDAEFLEQAVRRLPCGEDRNQPVTVDLNGTVTIRAAAQDQTQPTELVLSNSACSGKPVRFNTNRSFLSRAVRLGFREIHLNGPEEPAYCQSGRRSFVWALLDTEGTLKRSCKATRIESPPEPKPSPSMKPQQEKDRTAMAQTTPGQNGHTNPGEGDGIDAATTLIDQAEAVRGALMEALTQTRDLIVALKRQKKQARLVQSTLASLRQLQNVG